MEEEQTAMTSEKSEFTEEHRQPSRRRSPQKRRIIIIAVVVTLIVVAVVVAIVLSVVLTKKGGDGEAQKSDYTCGLTLPKGVNMSEVKGPTIISSRLTCDIKGSCWTKEQCYPCFDGRNNAKIGNINHMPVCCPNCGRYGLKISWDSCDCRN